MGDQIETSAFSEAKAPLISLTSNRRWRVRNSRI